HGDGGDVGASEQFVEACGGLDAEASRALGAQLGVGVPSGHDAGARMLGGLACVVVGMHVPEPHDPDTDLLRHAALPRVSIRAVRPEMWQRYHTLGERWGRRFRDAASRLLNHLSTPL